jgi:type II secretory pathway pseudopilin PulG
MTANTPRHESGMTLIEIAVVVIIAGVMLGAALSLYNKNRDQVAIGVTKERIHFIVSALSRYAETNNRIPCPADPSIVTARVAVVPPAGQEPWRFGFEWGINQPTASTRPGVGDCSAIARQRGIVPYQTLNIPFEYTKDGWGHYFSYAVSPVFTQATDFADTGTVADTTHRVDESCRSPGWVINNYPTNPPKARFCCARDGGALYDQPTDLIIQDKDKGFVQRSPNRANFASSTYDALTVPTRVSAGTTPLGKPLTRFRPGTASAVAAAFVLISHGPNGECSFLVNDTANMKGACSGDRDAENGDVDNVYYVGVRRITGDVNNFDDIVFWATQHSLMAYNGTSSCSLP